MPMAIHYLSCSSTKQRTQIFRASVRPFYMGIPRDISSLHHVTATRRVDGTEHHKKRWLEQNITHAHYYTAWYMRQQINCASWHLRTPIRVHNMRPSNPQHKSHTYVTTVIDAIWMMWQTKPNLLPHIYLHSVPFCRS